MCRDGASKCAKFEIPVFKLENRYFKLENRYVKLENRDIDRARKCRASVHIRARGGTPSAFVADPYTRDILFISCMAAEDQKYRLLVGTLIDEVYGEEGSSVKGDGHNTVTPAEHDSEAQPGGPEEAGAHQVLFGSAEARCRREIEFLMLLLCYVMLFGYVMSR